MTGPISKTHHTERIRTMYLTDWDLEAERASVMAEQREEREAESTMTAYAPEITYDGQSPSVRVVDYVSERVIGQADLIRGFAYYVGAHGTAHEGIYAVVAGGLDGLTKALAGGLRNGRDDRQTGI